MPLVSKVQQERNSYFYTLYVSIICIIPYSLFITCSFSNSTTYGKTNYLILFSSLVLYQHFLLSLYFHIQKKLYTPSCSFQFNFKCKYMKHDVLTHRRRMIRPETKFRLKIKENADSIFSGRQNCEKNNNPNRYFAIMSTAHTSNAGCRPDTSGLCGEYRR